MHPAGLVIGMDNGPPIGTSNTFQRVVEWLTPLKEPDLPVVVEPPREVPIVPAMLTQ